MSQTTEQGGVLSADDLRELDEKILSYLSDGRVTPAYARKRLEAEGEEYSRGYVQQRLARLEEHSHVENLFDSGLYELVDDPREETQSCPECGNAMNSVYEAGNEDPVMWVCNECGEKIEKDSDPDE